MDSNLHQLLYIIKEESGIDYSKSDIYQIKKREKEVQNILAKRGLSLSSFISDLENYKSSSLFQEILNVFTNNETAFFRDIRPFDLIEYLYNLNELPKKYLKVLSLPCSTGQETYSLLFKLLEIGYNESSLDITGADIDTNVIDKAISGKYNKFELMRGISNDRMNYFEKFEGTNLIKDKYRRLLKFHRFNLAKDNMDEESYDLILLRNVLFYFEDEYKEIILAKAARWLKKGGIIILGNGERVYCADLVEREFEGMPYLIKR